MKIITKGTKLKIDKTISDYIEEKIGGLESYFKNTDTETIKVLVEIEKTTDHHRKGDLFRCEINFDIPGKLLRAESTKEDIFIAINDARDKLQKEIVNFKKKPLTKYKRSARALKEAK